MLIRIIVLKHDASRTTLKAASFPEMLGINYQPKWRYIPENFDLQLYLIIADWNELPIVQHNYSRSSVVRTVWAETWSGLPINPDHRGEFRGIANVKKNHHTVPK